MARVTKPASEKRFPSSPECFFDEAETVPDHDGRLSTSAVLGEVEVAGAAAVAARKLDSLDCHGGSPSWPATLRHPPKSCQRKKRPARPAEVSRALCSACLARTIRTPVRTTSYRMGQAEPRTPAARHGLPGEGPRQPALPEALRLPASGGLRGRVTWHDSDRFDGTVRARELGQMAPGSGVRCR